MPKITGFVVLLAIFVVVVGVLSAQSSNRPMAKHWCRLGDLIGPMASHRGRVRPVRQRMGRSSACPTLTDFHEHPDSRSLSSRLVSP